jgi:hypothetical protein
MPIENPLRVGSLDASEANPEDHIEVIQPRVRGGSRLELWCDECRDTVLRSATRLDISKVDFRSRDISGQRHVLRIRRWVGLLRDELLEAAKLSGLQ